MDPAAGKVITWFLSDRARGLEKTSSPEQHQRVISICSWASDCEVQEQLKKIHGRSMLNEKSVETRNSAKGQQWTHAMVILRFCQHYDNRSRLSLGERPYDDIFSQQ